MKDHCLKIVLTSDILCKYRQVLLGPKILEFVKKKINKKTIEHQSKVLVHMKSFISMHINIHLLKRHLKTY